MVELSKQCIMEDKLCIECGECDHCNLNPDKLCDNCCRCIDSADYQSIWVDDIILEEDTHHKSIAPYKYRIKIKYKGRHQLKNEHTE